MIVILAKMEARAPTWETTTLNVSVPQALEETFVKKVTTLYIHCLLVLSGIFVFPIRRHILKTGHPAATLEKELVLVP